MERCQTSHSKMVATINRIIVEIESIVALKAIERILNFSLTRVARLKIVIRINNRINGMVGNSPNARMMELFKSMMEITIRNEEYRKVMILP